MGQEDTRKSIFQPPNKYNIAEYGLGEHTFALRGMI